MEEIGWKKTEKEKKKWFIADYNSEISLFTSTWIQNNRWFWLINPELVRLIIQLEELWTV